MSVSVIESQAQLEALRRAVERMMSRPPEPERNRARILDEYHRDKYGGILISDPLEWSDVLAAEAQQTGRHLETPEWISQGDQLTLGSAGEHDRQTDSLVVETLRRYPAAFVCELGCGFGRFLKSCDGRLQTGSRLQGGELSPNGVAVARRFGLDVSAQGDVLSVIAGRRIETRVALKSEHGF